MALLLQPCLIVDFVLILLFSGPHLLFQRSTSFFIAYHLNCSPGQPHSLFLGKHSAAAGLETIIPHITANLRQLEFNYSLLTSLAITKISFNTLTLRVEV